MACEDVDLDVGVVTVLGKGRRRRQVPVGSQDGAGHGPVTTTFVLSTAPEGPQSTSGSLGGAPRCRSPVWPRC